MIVGLDLSSAAKPLPSGTGVYAEGLARGLLEAGPADLRLVCGLKLSRFRRRRFLPELADGRARVRLFQDPLGRVTLGRLDVFHGLATDLPRLLRCPKVLTIHSLHTLEPALADLDGPDWRERRAARLRSLVARADAVVCLTDAGRARFLARFPEFPPDRARAIPHGVDLARFRPAEHLSRAEAAADEAVRRRLGCPEAGGYVLHVAQVQRRKNTARLIRAFLGCAAARGRALAIAGGAGFGADEAIAIATAPGVAERVRILGPVARADIPALLRGAAVLALPSLYEELGLPVLEAFACGVPVVASSAPSLPEVAGGAALLPDPGSEGAIADALETALADPARRADLRARGLARAAGLTWRACAARTLELYRDLVASPAR